jgi:hypothetical protein
MQDKVLQIREIPMGFRWRKMINFGGGARSTVTSRGVGVSWGFAGLRIGRAPNGSRWISFTIPGTGISFFKKLKSQSKFKGQQSPATPTSTSASPLQPHHIGPARPQTAPLTANQRIMERIRKKKP